MNDDLTKRELLAAIAMQGILANPQTSPCGMASSEGTVAAKAVTYADALLKQLAK